MSYLTYITLLGWESRNWRHQNKALLWCKDYGLTSVTKSFFVGELYAKERKSVEQKFKNLFTGKTEKFFFATMCKSCFNESMSDMNVQKKIKQIASFELVQMPEKA